MYLEHYVLLVDRRARCTCAQRIDVRSYHRPETLRRIVGLWQQTKNTDQRILFQASLVPPTQVSVILHIIDCTTTFVFNRLLSRETLRSDRHHKRCCLTSHPVTAWMTSKYLVNYNKRIAYPLFIVDNQNWKRQAQYFLCRNLR